MSWLYCSAELVVLHDTEQNHYEYRETLWLYHYRLEYRKWRPYTMLLSNYFQLTAFANLLGRNVVRHQRQVAKDLNEIPTLD